MAQKNYRNTEPTATSPILKNTEIDNELGSDGICSVKSNTSSIQKWFGSRSNHKNVFSHSEIRQFEKEYKGILYNNKIRVGKSFQAEIPRDHIDCPSNSFDKDKKKTERIIDKHTSGRKIDSLVRFDPV